MNSPCSLPLGADHGLLRFAIAAGTGKLGFHAPAAAARAPNSKRPAAARWAPWAPPLRAATSALAAGHWPALLVCPAPDLLSTVCRHR